MLPFVSPHTLSHLPPNTPVLLALSGGPDSRVLLHLLAADAQKNGYVLHTAHVHHGIRGKEADRDEQFCQELASAYQCCHHVLRADIPSIAKQTGESLEMAARRIRYDFFWQVMREHAIPLLATAHHADDNMETVLLRLCAGSSTLGLSGISAVTEPMDGCYVVRPLLEATREEILSYCRAEHLIAVSDSTNDDLSYRRNRIRAEVIPALSRVVPHPQNQVLRTCRQLREDDDYLSDLARARYQDALRTDGTLSLDILQATPPPICKRLLWIAVRQIAPNARLQLCHTEALLHIIRCGRGMSDLPGDLRAEVDGLTLRLLPHASPASPRLVDCFPLTLSPGTTVLPSLGLTIDVQETDVSNVESEQSQKFILKPQNVYNPFIHATLTFDTIIDGAYFRLRDGGDTILLRGMHRRVRKLQNAHAVPPFVRERLPILCDRDGILWVPFVGVRDGFCPLGASNTDENTHRRLTVTLTLACHDHLHKNIEV